ncbi:MAG: FAD-binding dehydrogenase [Denitrovibrio sp.]|nr:MAG: FAD-binding dehydrogenase [Denitrovibrio sp.]
MQSVLKKGILTIISVSLMFFAAVGYAKDRVYRTDVVVVGAGGSGLAAAVSAAQNGAKVIVLEKMAIAGGSTNYAEGLFAIGTKQLRNDGFDISKSEFYKQIMEYGHFRTDARLLRQFVEESDTTIEWLESLGVGFDAVKMSYADSPVWHLVLDYKEFHHGAALVNRLLDVGDELGVKVMYETPGTSLIYKNGAVQGVEGVDAKGNKVIVKAKSVIIATGGFPNSKAMIDKYTRFDGDKIIGTLPLQKNGDGINMSMKVGAATEGWGLMLHQATRGPGVKPFGDLFTMVWQPALWVNKFGKRFVDETAVFSFVHAANSVEHQPGSFAWEVFDQETFDKYTKVDGIEAGIGVIIPIGTKLTNLEAEFAKSEKDGNPNAVRANTIEELAKKMKVDPKILKKTIKNYNGYKENNLDKEFWMDPKWIMPVKKSTYYAIKIFPQAYVSLGGVKINERMQALDQNDNVIKGLYTVGCDVGGLYGDTYTLFASGSAFGIAQTSGRLAGADAAKSLK